jgi:hypothetical protein
MDIPVYRKIALALMFPGLFAAMLVIFAIGFVAMAVRNIGRWLNLFGEAVVGTYTYYADLWPLTGGALIADYKRYFGIGS